MLSIDRRPDGVVVIAGRLDAAQALAVQQFLDRVEGVVTLDLAGLEYISSAGLGVLLKTQKRLMNSAGRLQLVGVGYVRFLLQQVGVADESAGGGEKQTLVLR